MVQERELINTLRAQFSGKATGLMKGIGDDCALFTDNTQTCWLISTDLLVEKKHFDLDWHPPYTLGRKSIAVNLSDIAAMGGLPRFVLISLTLPAYLTDSWLNIFFQGVGDILLEYDCQLIGGDTTGGDSLTISVTVIGSAFQENVVYRSGAEVGHDIYVTGPLGASTVGLEMLCRGLSEESQFKEIIKSHLDPEPQVKVGSALAKSKLISAMQDISDGLSTDLSHICTESGVGAIIIEKKLPYLPGITTLCEKFHLDLCNCILNGGEDYQLVFTADMTNRSAIKNISTQLEQPFFRVGSVQPGNNVYLLSICEQLVDIQFRGFEHKTS